VTIFEGQKSGHHKNGSQYTISRSLVVIAVICAAHAAAKTHFCPLDFLLDGVTLRLHVLGIEQVVHCVFMPTVHLLSCDWTK